MSLLGERFAAALKSTRESAGMSQDTLADQAGLDRTYISQLERALKSPTLTTIEKIATVLKVAPHSLLRRAVGRASPRIPADYLLSDVDKLIVRRNTVALTVPADAIASAINVAHRLVDELYEVELDIAAVLGMRNLSAFIGELVAAAVIRTSGGTFERNPHQDGYPDLLLMDEIGRIAWDRLSGNRTDKAPFSPFEGGGIEVKATCGSVPTPNVCRRRGVARPDMGDTRIGSMTGYDWKARHRETNNLLGLVWDFIERRPRIVGMFYCGNLLEEDWGRIVQPRDGGGRTTSVSIMARSGIRKMYDGWLCVLATGGYAEFFDRKNDGNQLAAARR